MRKRVPLIKQHEEKDCGAACMAMILQYFGKKIPMATVAETIKVDQYGASIYGLLDGGAKFALEGMALEGTAEEFIKEVKGRKIGLPVIARVLSHRFEHYIVITKIRGTTVYVCDPDEGRKKLSLQNFEECFLGQIVCFEKTAEFIKENRKKGATMDFVKLITKQKGLLVSVSFLSLLILGISMGGTFLFQYLIDTVLPTVGTNLHHSEIWRKMQPFVFMIAAMATLYLIKYIVSIIRGRLLAYMSKRINLGLILGYYDHVIDLKTEFFDNHKIGDLMARLNDAGKVQDALSSVTLTLLIDVIMVLFCGYVLAKQSLLLFGIIAIVMLLYVLVSALYIRPMDKQNRQLMIDNGILTSYIKETLDGVLTIKASNANALVKEKTNRLLNTLQNHGINVSMMSLNRDALIDLIASLGTLSMLLLGTVLIGTGEMTLGNLMMFYTLLGYFLEPIQRVMELQGSIQSVVVAAGRLRDVLDRTKENVTRTDVKVPFSNGDIEFKDVDFRYGNRSLVLNKLNMNIQQGEHVALVGPSGCGKTTVTKLLLGFYEPEGGEVRIGGVSVSNNDLVDLRRYAAYVPQDVCLFSDTIRNNLMLGNESELSDEEIRAVMKACGCDFVEENLPFGLDTMLEEHGANLSGGQRQRLSIVRALLRKPKILLLDEATSNLDTISERMFLDCLKELYPDMTVIMVAHRLNSIQDCDCIYVMDRGTVVEQGKHEELLALEGVYANLCGEMR